MSVFEPILAGVQVRLISDPDEAFKIIDQLAKCKNCESYSQVDLFEFVCHFPEGGGDRYPEPDNCCECFYARDKRINYWIDKLVIMHMDLNGDADFNRQLFYHQEMETYMKFLGLEK